ncbi:MAG: DUF3127 domain-containing protein [Bacteroidales bacterium]|jgi:hypothetical protein|nr:DUF3127 domain-containing protein [Bacteroidales bacterium]
MAMDIKCKLLDKLAVQSGTSARGPWSKQDFIVETLEQYPRKICMNVWGQDKVNELQGFNPGEMLTISINIESREFNGRWYTDVRAWKIQREGAAEPQAAPAVDPFMNVSASDAEDDGGDLPF